MGMCDCFKESLINPTWEQSVEREPLLAFSYYLCGRVNALLAVASEITENLDQGFLDNCVISARIDRAETLMWLWTLGAYEVVRTMCQAKNGFSDKLMDQLAELKRTLSLARMSAAKMEKVGERKPVTSNRSPTGWDIAKQDLLINDPDLRPDISARSLLQEFDRVFSSITKDDVLRRHEETYGSGR